MASSVSAKQAARLEQDLAMIAAAIAQTRAEVAALKHGQDIGRTSDELQAIVAGTEQATNRILTASEHVDDLSRQIYKTSKDAAAVQSAQAIQTQMQIVFEACNFQDLTGQRISKVVKTMAFIETRIDEMLRIWGKSDLTAATRNVPSLERTGDAALLTDRPFLAKRPFRKAILT